MGVLGWRWIGLWVRAWRTMELAGYILGTGLIVLAAADAFMTIMLLKGGGFLTNFWTGRVWALAQMVHRRIPIHGFLSWLGPLMTFLAVLVWYSLILGGWALIFISGSDSVMVNSGSLPTDAMQRFYFTGTTLSGVGYGDLVPTSPPWTILANVAAFTTTFSITTSLSYILPVISAALDRRNLAEKIHSIGVTAPEIVEHSWTSGNNALMDSYWMDVIDSLGKHSDKHLVYPILHFFHSPNERGASALAILRLADAVFLIGQAREVEGSECPPPTFFRATLSALERFAAIKGRKMHGKKDDPDDQSREVLSPDTLVSLGMIPKEKEKFDKQLEEYLPLRSKLVSSCWSDGWDPSRGG